MQAIILPDRPQCEIDLAPDGPQMHKAGWSCQTWLGETGLYYAHAIKKDSPETLSEWYWLGSEPTAPPVA